MKDQLRGAVIEFGGVHGLHHAEFVGDPAEVRKQLREFDATFAVPVEFVGRAKKFGMASEERESLALEEFLGCELTVVFP